MEGEGSVLAFPHIPSAPPPEVWFLARYCLPWGSIYMHQPNGPPGTSLAKAEEGKRLAVPDRKLTPL